MITITILTVLAVLQVIPVSCGPDILINELAVNWKEHSYIELRAPKGLKTDTSIHYGFVILKCLPTSKTITVVGEFDLSNAKIAPMTEEEYFVIGSPKVSWFKKGFKNTPIKNQNTISSIYFKDEYRSLEVKESNLMVFVVTKAPISIFDVQLQNVKNNKLPNFANQPALAQYIIDHQIDCVIMRGKNAPLSKFPPLDNLFLNSQITPSTTKQVYLNALLGAMVPHEEKSMERCSIEDRGFNHAAFKAGKLSPGYENPCKGQRLIIEYATYRQARPLNRLHTEPEDEYDPELEDENDPIDADGGEPDLFDEVAPDQIDMGQVVKDLYDAAAQAETEICLNADSTDNSHARDTLHLADVSRERNALRNEVDEENKFETIEARIQREHVEQAVKVIAKSQSKLIGVNVVQANADWFQYNFNEANPEESTFSCYYCSHFLDKYHIHKGNMLSSPEGVLKATLKENNRIIREHRNKNSHQKVKEIHDQRQAAGIDSELFVELQNIEQEYPDYIPTNNVFRTAYTSGQTSTAFDNFPRLIENNRANGATMGAYCHSSYIVRKMTKIMDLVYRREIISSMKKSRHPFSLILDGSEDVARNHYMVVLIQVYNGVEVKVHFYRLMLLGFEEDADALINALMEKVGAKPEHGDEDDYDDWEDVFKDNLVASISDGASVMIGKDNGFCKKLGDRIGRPLFCHHCLNHRIELIHKHVAIEGRKKGTPSFPGFKAMCLNCVQLHKDVNDFASLYRKSHKLNNHKKHFMKLHFKDRPNFNLFNTQDTRWTASAYRALKGVNVNWYPFHQHLTSCIESPNLFIAQSRKRYRNERDVLADKNFLAALCLELDVDLVTKGISLQMQVKGTSIIGQDEIRGQMIDGYNKLKADGGNGGQYLMELLDTAMCFLKEVQIVVTDNNVAIQADVNPGHHGRKPSRKTTQEQEVFVWKKCRTLRRYEAAEKVRLFGISLYEERQDVDEECPDPPRYVRLSTYFHDYIEKLIEETSYIWPKHSSMKTFGRLDQTRWPFNIWEMTRDDEKKYTNKFQQWMDLLPNFSNDLTIDILEENFGRVIDYLKDNGRSSTLWCRVHKSPPSEFWSLILLKMGEELDRSFRRLMMATLSIPFGSADAERAFSILNYLKTRARNLLSPSIVESLMQIKYRKDSIYTFNANQMTDEFLKRGGTRCQDPSVFQQKILNQVEKSNKRPVSNLRIIGEETRTVGKSIKRKKGVNCFSLINAKTGLAVTSLRNSAVLMEWNNGDDQIWFWSGKYIASKDDGKVLQGSKQGGPVTVGWASGVKTQLWEEKMKSHHDSYLISHYNNMYLDVLKRREFDPELTISHVKFKQHPEWKVETVNCEDNERLPFSKIPKRTGTRGEEL